MPASEAVSDGLVGVVMLLTTDGGPHPADKWAAVAAEFVADLVQVADKSTTPAAATARKAKRSFIPALSEAIETAISTAMTDEQTRCNNGQVTSRFDPFQVDGYLDAVVTTVVQESKGTPFTSHFAKPETQAAVRSLLKQTFIDAMNNVRSWAFDARGL